MRVWPLALICSTWLNTLAWADTQRSGGFDGPEGGANRAEHQTDNLPPAQRPSRAEVEADIAAGRNLAHPDAGRGVGHGRADDEHGRGR